MPIEDFWGDWSRLMNVPTLEMKPPLRYTPLMCCLDAQRSPTSSMAPSEQVALKQMVWFIVGGCTVGTLRNTAVGGGNFAHLARGPWLLQIALDAVYQREGSHKTYGEEFAEFICNQPGKGGHGPFDIHWNNRALRDVVKKFGGVSIKEVQSAHGRGHHGHAGSGTKDGVTPDHPWHRKHGYE